MFYLMRQISKSHLQGLGPFLKSFDVDAHDGRGEANFTHERCRALRFATEEAGRRAWNSISKVKPVRDDGQSNRPLTAFTMEFVPIKTIEDLTLTDHERFSFDHMLEAWSYQNLDIYVDTLTSKEATDQHLKTLKNSDMVAYQQWKNLLDMHWHPSTTEAQRQRIIEVATAALIVKGELMGIG